MRLRNLTRRREIGANCYLLESGNCRYVLDAGMHPKQVGMDALPNYAAVPYDNVEAVLITHAHHDHIGSLPALQRKLPNTPVYMTEITGEIGAAMLHNSVNVMSSQRLELNISEYPFFTHAEVDEVKRLWNYVNLRRKVELPGDADIDATFFDAGHILGSAGILLREGDKSLFYTGDVCFEPQTLSMAADFPTEGVDVLVMETTRGDQQRPADYSRKAEKERLGKLICDTFDATGSVLIPVFALGKTQEVMLMLHELHTHDLIPEMPLFIGGLSTKVTLLHDQYAEKSRRNYPGFSLLRDINMLVAQRRKKREIQYNTRCIYALSSGMMSENTVSNQFAQTFLENPRNSVAFVGYTDPDSPGARVRKAKPGEKVQLDKHRLPVEVNSRIESFDLSAHATRESLLNYAITLRPKKILLVHGDESAQLWFEAKLKEALPQTEIVRPDPEGWVELW
ncbi:MAG: MBL fold metallo-hydrolase [Verrucomicrobiaceae bacterium]|nr:MBL fold metallo-hydrolase [Verrucomicrobiaceae bacterium]